MIQIAIIKQSINDRIYIYFINESFLTEIDEIDII